MKAPLLPVQVPSGMIEVLQALADACDAPDLPPWHLRALTVSFPAGATGRHELRGASLARFYSAFGRCVGRLRMRIAAVDALRGGVLQLACESESDAVEELRLAWSADLYKPIDADPFRLDVVSAPNLAVVKCAGLNERGAADVIDSLASSLSRGCIPSLRTLEIEIAYRILDPKPLMAMLQGGRAQLQDATGGARWRLHVTSEAADQGATVRFAVKFTSKG